jgi:hypothetical protein
MTEKYLQDFFKTLADEEIAARIQRGLTGEGDEIARRELQSRGVEPPPAAAEPEDAELPYLGDKVIIARDLNPTEAHVIASCLVAAGIQADAGDVDTVRGNSLWSIALGGAKVRVPQSQLAEAQQVLAAFRRGEFALPDDFDVGKEID